MSDVERKLAQSVSSQDSIIWVPVWKSFSLRPRDLRLDFLGKIQNFSVISYGEKQQQQQQQIAGFQH